MCLRMCSPNHEAHRHAWASVLGIERLDRCFEEAPGGLVRQPDQRMRNHLDVKRSRLGSRALRTRSLRRTSHRRRRAPCRQVLSWPRTDTYLHSLFRSGRRYSPAGRELHRSARRARTQSLAAPGRTCRATPVAIILQIKAPICGPRRTTCRDPKHTATTPALPGTGSRGCGGNPPPPTGSLVPAHLSNPTSADPSDSRPVYALPRTVVPAAFPLRRAPAFCLKTFLEEPFTPH